MIGGSIGPHKIDGAVPCGGVTKRIGVALVASTGIYAAGDNIGGKLTFADAARQPGGTGVIQSLTLIDQDNEKTEKDVFFFDTDPAATTATDNAAQDIADADLLRCIGWVNIPASAYKSAADNAIATVANIGLAFDLPTDATALYAIVVERGTPTYTAASDLQLNLFVLQD